MKTALPLVIFTMIIGEWGVPQTEQFARNMRSIAQSGGSMLATKDGFWAKDGNSFIYINHIKNEKSLDNVLIYQFGEGQNKRELQSVLKARTANYSDEKGWVLSKVEKSTVGENQIQQAKQPDQVWQTSLTPSKLGIVSLKPESLSISGLADYVGFLKRYRTRSETF